MGLDITAYSQLEKVDAVFDIDGEPIDPQTRRPLDKVVNFYVNNGFQGRSGDIENDIVYQYSKSLQFRMGSYGYYHDWRNELARIARYPAVAVDPFNSGDVQIRNDVGAWNANGGPFWELINFSDCEGVIGCKVCKKLADDFAIYQREVDAHNDEYFRTKYAELRAAFDLATNDGAVNFH